jgi:hypothetical protein
MSRCSSDEAGFQLWMLRAQVLQLSYARWPAQEVSNCPHKVIPPRNHRLMSLSREVTNAMSVDRMPSPVIRDGDGRGQPKIALHEERLKLDLVLRGLSVRTFAPIGVLEIGI